MKKCVYLKLVYMFFLVLSLFIVSGCNNQVIDKNVYLSLTGESENWSLNGYEVTMDSEEFKAGNGILSMKNKNEYISDSFHFETHVVILSEDMRVHAGSVSGKGINIEEQTTGTIEGGTYLNDKGFPITLEDISEIYMIIEWWDMSKNKNVEERLDLYKQL